jgi:hypothetical protein
MKDKEYYLLIGVVVGGVLWASVSSLIENNGLPAIIGLAFSCLVMGVAMGMNIGGWND